MIQDSAIFSNDFQGYIKLLAAVVASNATLGGLIGFWLKKRDDARWKNFQDALNGLGARLNTVDSERKVDFAWISRAENELIRDRGEAKSIRDRTAKLEASMEGLSKDIHNQHREMRDLLEQVGRNQMAAVHKVELEVAKLSERGNIGDALKELGTSLEKAARIAMKREEE